ncbi:hypothetical protein MMC17_007456 [Xylographa soralifera]|nr:hypothetical protein [Xylographa soralifera]
MATLKREEIDVEKSATATADTSSSTADNLQHIKAAPNGLLDRWNIGVATISFLEERGIERVLPIDRYEVTAASYAQMLFLWFSTNLTANNLAVSLLGPLAFGLGFVDSALCAVFGGIVGAAGPAYMSTWGPASGNRTMVVARYFMGYYPSKIACFLNIIIMLGYGMIDCLIGGQVLSAVADGNLSIVVGIFINAIITWFVATFGMSVFHLYERWAWAPQIVVLFVLVGSAGPRIDPFFASALQGTTLNASRLSFLSLCLSASISWAPAAADYYVYYPEHTKKWKTFTLTWIGISVSFAFVYLLGVGLATGTFSNPDWNDAYGVSSGVLILAGYGGLGGFGKFCGVIIALGVIANNIPGTYSAALGIQVMGRYGARVPRWLLTCVSVLIYTACALGGRNNLLGIFENFLALMGYWVAIFLAIVLEEHLIFRRRSGFDWTAWADPKRLPIGIAGLTAFLVGWAGAIVCMDQVWYVGPIAKMVGDTGADLGIWVGSGWTLLVFPPLRAWELKRYHR